jgi:CTP synthase
LGIIPDILVCRSEKPLEADTRAKLAAFCHVDEEAVVSAHDVSNLYQIPSSFYEQSVLRKVSQQLGFEVPDELPFLDEWQRMADKIDTLSEEVHIAMVGK